MIMCYDDQLLCQTIQKPCSKREVLKVMAKRKCNAINYHQSDLNAEEKEKRPLLSYKQMTKSSKTSFYVHWNVLCRVTTIFYFILRCA